MFLRITIICFTTKSLPRRLSYSSDEVLKTNFCGLGLARSRPSAGVLVLKRCGLGLVFFTLVSRPDIFEYFVA